MHTAQGYAKRLHPSQRSIHLALNPLSTINYTLPATDHVENLAWVEDTAPDGEMGYYRIASVNTDTRTGTQEVYAEHGACLLDDQIIRDTSTGGNTFSWTGTIRTILENILKDNGSYRTKWQIGTVEADRTIYIEPGGMSLMTALLTMMNSIPSYQLDFVQASADDWHIDIKQRPTEPVCEARLKRNLQSCEITYSTSGMCTRVYCDGITGGVMESQNLSIYGVYEQTMTLNDALTTEDKEAIVAAYLAQHDHPSISVNISAVELCNITGLSIDRFRKGTVLRVAIPWLGITVDEVIIEKDYPDAENEPENVMLTLANATPDLSLAVANITGGLETSAAGVGSGRGGSASSAQRETEQVKKRYETKFEKTDEYFRLLATDTDWSNLKDGTLQSYAQIVLNSQAFQTVVANERNHNSTTITQTADAITSTVIGVTASDVFIGDGTNGTEVGKRYRVTHRDADGKPTAWVEYTPVQSQITQEANMITAEVTRATDAENTLSGRVSVTENQVGMVVEKKDGKNVIKAASIVAEINKTTGDSNAIIQADHVYLDANKTANIGNSFFMSSGQIWIKKAVMIGESSHVTFNNGTMNAPTVQVNSGGALKFSPSSQSGTVISIDHAKASGLLTEVQIAQPASGSNTYTLQYKKVGGGDTWFTPANGTFSRAIASWTAVAGNGAVTMTANPQNQALTHAVKPIKVNDAFGSTFTSNVYNGDAIVSGIGMKLVANTTDNVVEARLVDSTLASDTLLAKLPVTFGGNVTFGDWTWNSYAGSSCPSQRTVSIDASDSGGGSDTASLSMMLSPRGWNKEGAGAYKQYVNLYAPNTDNTVRAQITVDATSLVSSAPVSGSWDADTQTFTAAVDTSGTSQTASTKVLLTVQKASTTSDLNDKLDVLVHHDSVTGTNLIANKRVTLSANNTAAAALSNTNTTRTGTAKVRAGISSTYYAEFGHTIAVDGGSDIATAGGTSDVTFSLDGVVVGRKRVKATYSGDASGNVTLSSMAAGSGNVTYSQDTQKTYVSLPVDYTLSNGTTGTKPVNTVKFPFGVTLTPSKSGSNLAVSATVPGTSGALTVNSGTYAVSNLYTLTEKTAAQLNDASTGNRLDGAVGTVINGNLSYSTAYTGMGRVWANPAAVSGHTDQMTITSYLSNATSTSASHYAKKETTIALSSDKATLGPGEAATISAKVGSGTYASIAVSARAINLRTGVEVTPSTEAQTINYDGYDGLGTVTVKAAAPSGGDLTAWSWSDVGSSNEHNTVSIGIDGTSKSNSLKLVLTQSASWDASYQKKVYLRDTSVQGNLHASITVDASTVYTAGRNSSRITYQHSATAADGTWVTFTPSNPYTISGEFVAVLHEGGAQFFYGGGGGTPTPTGHSISVTADGTDISKQSNGTYVDKSGNTVTVNADFALGAGHNKRFKITCGTATYYIRVTPT
jgi:hypothetical protein